MKTKNLLFAVLLAAVPLSGFAQEWDDIYADPSRSREERKAQTKKQEQPPKKKVVIVQGEAPGMEVIANGRDIDEYNRRAPMIPPDWMKRAISTIMKSTSIPIESFGFTTRNRASRSRVPTR